VFAAELLINLYANWFRTFARNGWNWWAPTRGWDGEKIGQ
jgi:hypothetical protein